MIERLYRWYVACLVAGTTVYMFMCIIARIIRRLYLDYIRNR